MKKIIKWLLFILWLVIIFLFSNQPYSGASTHNIIEKIIPILKNSNWINIINFSIRKIAHITEYFILCILTMLLLKEYTKNERIIIVSSILFCFFYACTDEIHQSFILGRSSKFTDVLIDTIGVLLYLFIYKISPKKEAYKFL